MTKQEAIDRVIAIATAEIGYLEKKSNSRLDSKTENAGQNNYTKYWRDIKPSYQGQPWCACFVTWCFVQAFGIDTTKKLLKHYPYVYCPAMSSLFILNSNPQKGDIVIFYRNGTFAHTGIVTGVNGDYFTTIEGNTSGGSTIIANGGGVCAKGYYNSQLPGTKFITVNWSLAADADDTSSSPSWTETAPEINVDAKVISSISIKDMPSDSMHTIGELIPGDIIHIDAWTDNGWYKTYFSTLGSFGYVKQSDVELISVSKETNIEQILYALHERTIISDVDLWRTYAAKDINIYYLLQNILYYAEIKKRGETADTDYENIEDILWDLNHRKVISDINLWRNKANSDANIYWLLRKSLWYFRTL